MEEDRSLWAFVRAIRSYPGFGARVAAATCLVAAGVEESGLEATLMIVGATILASFAIGYPLWRRLGTRSPRWD